MRPLQYGFFALLAAFLAAFLLATGLPAQRPEQAPEFTRQALLIVNFTPPTIEDLDLGRDAGNAVRSRMARLANDADLDVIDGGKIDRELRRFDYDPDASFTLLDMFAVGRFLRADEYIVGRVERNADQIKLSGDLRLVRDVHFRQPLPIAVATSVDSVAQLFAQSIAVARKQLAPQRRCENDLRANHPDLAIAAAREGVKIYPRSTLARTCLVVALTAAHAPSVEVLATAKEVLAIDSANTYALQSGAAALDVLHRSAEAAAMWVALYQTDTTNVDFGLLATGGLLTGGNAKVAEPIIDRLVQEHPDNMELLERKWHVTYENENWHEALDAGERIAAKDTMLRKDPQFVRELAVAYESSNDPYRAIATLAEGVSSHPGDEALYDAYSRYIRAEADTVVPRGLALFPKNARLLVQSATDLREKGKLSESLDATKRAVALDSTISDGQLAIAQLEVQVGHLDSALVALHRALGSGTDTSLVAQFALTQGDSLYRAAEGTKLSSDFENALSFLAFSDTLQSSSQSRFLVGAAAMGVAQAVLIEATATPDKTEGCRLTQLGAAMVPIARTGLQAGEGDLADAAKQSLDFLQQFDPYVGRELKSLCAQSAAQTAVFAGDVARDTLNHRVPGATVEIAALNRTVVTDTNGEFKMSGLPSGHYGATIHRLGFIAMTDTFDLVTGSSVEREYVMDPAPTVLDSVVTNAVRQPDFVAPGLSEFEERRKSSIGGYFVTDSVLRQNDSRKLNDILTARIPSLSTYQPYPQTQPNVEYLSSGRGGCAGPAFSCGGGSTVCPVTLYLNGALFYAASMNVDVPDIAQFEVLDLEGVEYYAGGATVPVKYNATSSGCGVLLLWTKEE